MGKLTKNLLIAGLVLVVLGLVWFLGYQTAKPRKHISVSSDVLLESVKNVVKFGTVEGNFSEIYSYQDYNYYDISLLRKKVLIRVKAKVLVGFNLEKLDIKVDHAAKKIKLGKIPKAEILAIDHNLDYYDITEGVFNSFGREDHNMLQRETKDMIRKKAQGSNLFSRAEAELEQHLKVLEDLLKGSGWEIEYQYDKPEKIVN